MEKEDILAISRKENKSRDLAELETALQAGSVAARVGAGMTPDAVVMDAEGAITALGEITGETVTDAVVTRIFSDFCVGK